MRQVVQVVQKPEVCGEEDVCSAFGHQIAGMVSGMPIHLSVTTHCHAILALAAPYNVTGLQITE